MNFIDYIAARLAERSTWLGFIGFFSVFGISIAPALQEPIITVGVGIASLISMFSGDKTGK